MRHAPLSAYRPGTSVLHRLPAGVKLLGLVAIGVTVVALRGPLALGCAVALALATAFLARITPADLWRGLRPLLLIVAVLAGFQWWQRGAATAFEVAATIMTLAIMATIVTATTPTDAILDAIVRGLGPFRRIGVNPDKVALSFSLMLAAIPRIAQIAGETRDAARARGLERHPRAYLTPMAIRTVAHAQSTGEALAARGIGDDDGGGNAP